MDNPARRTHLADRFAERLTVFVVADKVRVDHVRPMGRQRRDAARGADRGAIDVVIIKTHEPHHGREIDQGELIRVAGWMHK